MRDPMFDPEMMMDIIRRRESGFVYDAGEQMSSENTQQEDETADDIKTTNIFLTHQYTAIPIILLLTAGILSLMIILAVLQITLLPIIMLHDWWTQIYARRRRVLKKVSPEVRHMTK